MAKKDHSLDQGIIEAAKQEFLENGFANASLRKIATNANVTIGAIYTRYKTKDILFASLVSPLIDAINNAFQQLQQTFMSTSPTSVEELFHNMESESNAILHLLFDDYTSSKLLLCKSSGSSLEHFFDDVVDHKIAASLCFFDQTKTTPQFKATLKILISSQFQSYFQIIHEGYELAEAKLIMHDIMKYHFAGWQSLFLSYQS